MLEHPSLYSIPLYTQPPQIEFGRICLILCTVLHSALSSMAPSVASPKDTQQNSQKIFKSASLSKRKVFCSARNSGAAPREAPERSVPARSTWSTNSWPSPPAFDSKKLKCNTGATASTWYHSRFHGFASWSFLSTQPRQRLRRGRDRIWLQGVGQGVGRRENGTGEQLSVIGG